MAVKTRNQVSPVKRVTRANVKEGLIAEPETSPSSVTANSSNRKTKKKVKFLDPGKEVEPNKNNSLVSDEGIDMSFSPSLQVPPAISRPHHKLQSSWTLWYSPRNNKSNWCENQHQVCSMSSVEDFWHCYNQIKLASKLPTGSTYAVFRKGINPDWEDEANAQGGRWMIYFDKMDRHSQMDSRWMEVLLLALGNHLGLSVAGVQVCIRKKFDRIEVWLGNSSKMRSVAEIGRKLKQQLGFDATKMEFSIHTEEKEGLHGPCLMI